MGFPLRALCALLCASVLVCASASPVGAEAGYSPPVDGDVVDGWRPPATLFGSGNRGIDLAAEPGEAVRSAAAGTVVFAGRVGLDHHVVVLHGDGIRTSYSFLESTGVARGDAVERGDPVGTAAGPVHFGARAGDRYVDPNLLLRGQPPSVRLVPVELRVPQPEATERRWLLDGLAGVARAGWRAGSAAAAWAAGEAADVAGAGIGHVRGEVERMYVVVAGLSHMATAPAQAVTQVLRGLEYHRDQDGCTPGSTAPGPPPGGRRIAVLVAGFGSSSEQAAVLGVDTAGLGYADGDVGLFSYAGGQAPGGRMIEGVSSSTYVPADSQQALEESADRLRSLLQEVRSRHPGVPVDLIAHSQGGVVALLALREGDRHDPRMPQLGHIVTLGSPHDGTDLATAASVLSRTSFGGRAEALGAGSPAAEDLSERSALIRRHRRRPLPEGVAVTSVAAAGDLTVPATHSVLPGEAVHALVPLHGIRAHERLPGSPEAHREMALALAGMGPTCRSVWLGVAGAAGISAAEDLAGAALGGAAAWADLPPGSGGARPPAPAPGRVARPLNGGANRHAPSSTHGRPARRTPGEGAPAEPWEESETWRLSSP
jgi:hypothetical protein